MNAAFNRPGHHTMATQLRPFVLLCLLAALPAAPARASDQVPGKAQVRPVVIVGATIHPVSGPAIENGSILFDKGKIVAVGRQVTVPDGADVVHAEGKHVYPGLISADTYIGLTEIGAVRASNDHTEAGGVNPNARAEAAWNPDSEIIPVTRANGITLVVTAPRGGLVAGTGAVMMMDGWTREDMTLRAPAALYVNWPSMSIVRAWWMQQSEEEQKKSREKALAEITAAFRDARAYMTAKKAQGAPGVPALETDLRWEAMIPVLEGTVPVVVWAPEIRQIEAAVAWAEQEGVRLVIGGGHDAWRAAELLKARDIPVLAGGIHRLPSRRFEDYDAPFMLPRRLHEAGIRFAIISQDEAPHERSLPYQAATAAAYGLPKDEALRAVTLYPAQIFGVADRVGSLDPGKDATLIVTSGDPLEIMCTVEAEYIQGRAVDLTSRHTDLYDKYLEKYRRLR